MYHGTGGIHPSVVLKEEKQLDVWYANTDPRYSIYGVGLYFAKAAWYSNSGYTYENPETGLRCMIMAWVFPGKCVETM